MSLEIKVNLEEEEAKVEGLPEGYSVQTLLRDTNNVLYLVTYHKVDASPDEKRKIENELDDITRRLRTLGRCSASSSIDLMAKEIEEEDKYRRRQIELLAKQMSLNSNLRYDLFIGKAGETMAQAQEVMFNRERDGGTIYINFVFDGKEGEIFVPNPNYLAQNAFMSKGHKVHDVKEGPELKYDGKVLKIRQVPVHH